VYGSKPDTSQKRKSREGEREKGQGMREGIKGEKERGRRD
jgi:hypothetical protein